MTINETAAFTYFAYPSYATDQVSAEIETSGVVTLSETNGTVTVTAIGEGSTNILIVNYNLETLATIPVSVIGLYEIILIEGTPTKTSYVTGEAIDLSGLTVVGMYDDLSTVTIDPNDYTLTADPSVAPSDLGTFSITVTAVLKADASLTDDETYSSLSVDHVGLTYTVDNDVATGSNAYRARALVNGNDNIGYYGLNAFYYLTNSMMQMNKDVADIDSESNYGYVANATPMPSLSKIVIAYDSANWNGTTTMYGGTSYNPTSEITGEQNASASTITFDFSNTDYNYFKYVHTATGTARIASIEIQFVYNDLPLYSDVYNDIFATRLSSQCNSLDVKETNWSVLSNIYSALKEKETITLDSDNFQKYQFICGKYSYEDFMLLSSGSARNTNMAAEDASTYIAILAIAGGAVLAGGLFFAMKKKYGREEE